MKTVTVIGGGTGTFIILTALKKIPIKIKAIVSMMDSGGSTGRLRDQLGVLPPGDLRQCLVALSDASILWRKLFLYRFETGDLRGHNFGNIFISALEKVSKNYQEVVDVASYILKTKGEVIPVTFKKTDLIAKYNNGKILTGEEKIDQYKNQRTKIIDIFLSNNVPANPKAVDAIKQSDHIIIGPGDIYTSLIPPLLINKINNTIQKTKAKIIYIVNLMTKKGQTNKYTAKDHLETIAKYLNRKPEIVIINNDKIPDSILKWYYKNKEEVVTDDLFTESNLKVIREDLINKTPYKKSKVDTLSRSILRHDPNKLADVLKKILI
jgi:uncharacterized cofD-like protein